MTPEEFQAAREALHWPRATLARLLGYGSENSIRQIEAGVQAPRPEDAAWLARVAAPIRRYPAPER